MAIEIAGSELGEPVTLTGAAARRFVEETKNPKDDGRRAEHLRRSAETYERVFSEKTANELFRDQ